MVMFRTARSCANDNPITIKLQPVPRYASKENFGGVAVVLKCRMPSLLDTLIRTLTMLPGVQAVFLFCSRHRWQEHFSGYLHL